MAGFLRWASTTDGILSIIGIVLTIIVAIGWILSNRAEATPNADQLAEIRRFVTEQFAKYVATGLAGTGSGVMYILADPENDHCNCTHHMNLRTGSLRVSQDPVWQKIFLQHFRLHNELYSFRHDVALQVFKEEIDHAVARHLLEIRAAHPELIPVSPEETHDAQHAHAAAVSASH